MRLAFFSVLGGVLVSCASSEIRGGETAGARRQLAGTVLDRFVTSDCRDKAGAPWEHASRVTLLKDASGVGFLVESSTDTDQLVVRNRFEEGGEVVYQAIVSHAGGASVLHDFRVPKQGAGGGRMAVTEHFTERAGSEGAFQATPGVPAIACRLAPVLPEAEVEADTADGSSFDAAARRSADAGPADLPDAGAGGS